MWGFLRDLGKEGPELTLGKDGLSHSRGGHPHNKKYVSAYCPKQTKFYTKIYFMQEINLFLKDATVETNMLD